MSRYSRWFSHFKICHKSVSKALTALIPALCNIVSVVRAGRKCCSRIIWALPKNNTALYWANFIEWSLLGENNMASSTRVLSPETQYAVVRDKLMKELMSCYNKAASFHKIWWANTSINNPNNDELNLLWKEVIAVKFSSPETLTDRNILASLREIIGTKILSMDSLHIENLKENNADNINKLTNMLQAVINVIVTPSLSNQKALLETISHAPEFKYSNKNQVKRAFDLLLILLNTCLNWTFCYEAADVSETAIAEALTKDLFSNMYQLPGEAFSNYSDALAGVKTLINALSQHKSAIAQQVYNSVALLQPLLTETSDEELKPLMIALANALIQVVKLPNTVAVEKLEDCNVDVELYLPYGDNVGEIKKENILRSVNETTTLLQNHSKKLAIGIYQDLRKNFSEKTLITLYQQRYFTDTAKVKTFMSPDNNENVSSSMATIMQGLNLTKLDTDEKLQTNSQPNVAIIASTASQQPTQINNHSSNPGSTEAKSYRIF